MLKRLFSHYIADEVRPMLRLAAPLVLAEVGWMSMIIVDTIMVGRQSNSAVAIAADLLNHMQFLTIRRYLSLVFTVLVTLLLVLAIWL